MIKDAMGVEVRELVNKLYVPFTDHQKQIAELEAENKRLREALKIYANPDKWAQRYGNQGAWDWFLCGHSGWDIAESALARMNAGD